MNAAPALRKTPVLRRNAGRTAGTRLQWFSDRPIPYASAGVAGAETQQFAAKLEKMTGYSIAELAVHADQWPDI